MQKIIHGDCLKVLAEMPAASIDLVCTDPPYGNNIAYYGNKTIAGDTDPLSGLRAVAASYRLLRRNTPAYVFTDVRHLPFMHAFIRDYTDFKIKEVLVWDKGRIGLGQGFRKQHEHIVVLEKGKPIYRFKGLSNLLIHRNPINKVHPHE